MNVWRWLGISIFLLGTVCLLGTTKFSAYAKDKTTDAPKKTDEPKKTDAPKKTDEPKKTEEPKKTDTPKKTEEPKKTDEPKKVEPGKGDLSFDAFKSKSKKFYQKQFTKTKQEMKVMGQVVIQTQEQTFMIEWTPGEEDKDKNYVVSQKIVGVKMEINIGGNKITYDSTAATKQKNPMTDFFEQLTKQELKFTIKSDLSEVKSIEGRDTFIKGLSDINPQMQSLLKAILSDKALQKMAEPTWYAFPPGGVIPASKTWSRKSDLDLGPIGKYDTNFDFTYNGQDGTKDKIGIKTKLTYTAPDAASKAGLPFIIHDAKLSATDGTGTAVFDRSKGRFESTDINMKLTGTLTIEVGNMKTTVELNQEQNSNSTTMDELPADWKAKTP